MPPRGSRAAKKNAKPTTTEEEDLDALWNGGTGAPSAAVEASAPASTSSSEDSYFGAEDEEEGSSQAHSSESEGEAAVPSPAAGQDAKPALLSALTAFTRVDGPPAFLSPEATKPLAAVVHRPSTAKAQQVGATNQGTNKRGDAKGEWDISRMAPKLRDEAAPAGPGVIKASAVQYRGGDAPAAPTAAAIAMLGGGEKPDRGKATKAMGVEEFLDKGAGGAVLPRKRQERKDREKDKRVKGQSSHAAWKSEAEMVLRQQYD